MAHLLSPHRAEIAQNVGERIRTRRAEVGMTQRAVGDAVWGTPCEQIMRYEQGKGRIPAGRLYGIAARLGVSLSYLFETIQLPIPEPLEDATSERPKLLACSEEEMQNFIAKRFARRRRELDWSYEHFEKKCLVSRQELMEIERGTRPMHAATLYQVAGALRVSIEYFFFGIQKQYQPLKYVEAKPLVYAGREKPRVTPFVLKKQKGPVKSLCTDANLRIGTRIRKRRRLLGITQKDLALRLGVSHQTVHSHECGSLPVPIDRLFKIGIELDVGVEHFLSELLLSPAESSETSRTSFAA